MDDIKSGFKKLFGAKSGKFKGEGRKLGHGDDAKASSTANSSNQSASSSSSSQAFSGAGHRLGSRPADATAPQKVQQPPVRPSPPGPAQPRATPLGIADTSKNNTTPVDMAPAPNSVSAQEASISDEMHLAAALMCSAGEEGTSAGARVVQILSNVQRDPTNAKFCKLRTSNNIIAAVLKAPGAAELLGEAAFVPLEIDGEVFLVLHDPLQALPRVRGALQVLSQALAAVTPSPAQASTSAAAPVPQQPSTQPAAAASPPLADSASPSDTVAVAATANAENDVDSEPSTRQPQATPGPADVDGLDPVGQILEGEAASSLPSAAPAASVPSDTPAEAPESATDSVATKRSAGGGLSAGNLAVGDSGGETGARAGVNQPSAVGALADDDRLDALQPAVEWQGAAGEVGAGGQEPVSQGSAPEAGISQAPQQELGMSAEEWRGQNGGKAGAITVGGMRVEAPKTQELGISKEEWAARAKAEAAAAESSLPPEPFTGRNTQVVLPMAADTELPSWFFDRTSADVKRDYFSARKRAEESQVLMTRAMREKQLEKWRRKHVFATIRVRFPEGCMLQGDFHEEEPVSNIAAWVAFALREPLTFSLASPALPGKNKRLGDVGTIKSLQLMPSFLFNFSWDEPTNLGKTVPCLSDEWLEATKQRYDM